MFRDLAQKPKWPWQTNQANKPVKLFPTYGEYWEWANLTCEMAVPGLQRLQVQLWLFHPVLVADC